MENYSSASSASSGGCCQIIIFAIVIYIMVIFFNNTLPIYNNKYIYDGLSEIYREQIDWMYIFGAYHTSMFFVSLGSLILTALILCCSQEGAIITFIVLFVLCSFSNIVSQSIFINLGSDLHSELNMFCFNNVVNVTTCDYYKTYFNPGYIINIVLLTIDVLNFFLMLCLGTISMINQ